MDDPLYLRATTMKDKPKGIDIKKVPDFRIHHGKCWYYFKQKQVRSGSLFLWYSTDNFSFLDNASEMRVNLTNGEMRFRHGQYQKWGKGADKFLQSERVLGLRICAEYISQIDDILLGKNK